MYFQHPMNPDVYSSYCFKVLTGITNEMITKAQSTDEDIKQAYTCGRYLSVDF